MHIVQGIRRQWEDKRLIFTTIGENNCKNLGSCYWSLQGEWIEVIREAVVYWRVGSYNKV